MAVAAVLVVEDDTFSRTLVTSALHNHDCTVVGSTASAAHAVALARSGVVDVALLDLDLGPGPTGFELAVVLRREFPTIGIVFLTSYQDPRPLVGPRTTIPLGSRFVQKASLVDPRVLIATIAQAKRAPLAPQPVAPLDASMLTSHQLQVLKMVAEGKSSKDIARHTLVTVKAVEATISRILRILNDGGDDVGNSRVFLARSYYAMTGRSAPRE